VDRPSPNSGTATRIGRATTGRTGSIPAHARRCTGADEAESVFDDAADSATGAGAAAGPGAPSTAGLFARPLRRRMPTVYRPAEARVTRLAICAT